MSHFLPGAMAFLRPGGTIRDMHDGSTLLVTFRMMTLPVLVLGMTTRQLEECDTVSQGLIILTPGEGICLVSENNLMFQEEMIDTVYVRYGQGSSRLREMITK